MKIEAIFEIWFKSKTLRHGVLEPAGIKKVKICLTNCCLVYDNGSVFFIFSKFWEKMPFLFFHLLNNFRYSCWIRYWNFTVAVPFTFSYLSFLQKQKQGSIQSGHYKIYKFCISVIKVILIIGFIFKHLCKNRCSNCW